MNHSTTRFSRRAALTGAAALPFAAAIATPAQAAAPMLGTQSALYNRVKLGEFEVTTLLSSSRVVKKPQNLFGMNASPEEFAAASAAAFVPTDKARLFFAPTVVNTGTELVLFDTGWKAADTLSALTAAGYSPDQIDVVVLTHMHPDHIGGLRSEGVTTFPNARYVTGSVEFNEWDGAENKVFEAQMRPLAEQTTFVDGGASVVSGITAVETFGHTPGHMSFMIESNGKQLLIGGDFANHHVWALAYPDWAFRFDQDKPAAAATRRRILDMLVADQVPLVGFHLPWPGIGYIETRDEGFRFVPHSYQLIL